MSSPEFFISFRILLFFRSERARVNERAVERPAAFIHRFGTENYFALFTFEAPFTAKSNARYKLLRGSFRGSVVKNCFSFTAAAYDAGEHPQRGWEKAHTETGEEFHQASVHHAAVSELHDKIDSGEETRGYEEKKALKN